jgi:hypothetical protein
MAHFRRRDSSFASRQNHNTGEKSYHISSIRSISSSSSSNSTGTSAATPAAIAYLRQASFHTAVTDFGSGSVATAVMNDAALINLSRHSIPRNSNNQQAFESESAMHPSPASETWNAD